MRARLARLRREPIAIARNSIRDSDTETSNVVCAPSGARELRSPDAWGFGASLFHALLKRTPRYLGAGMSLA
jgi:hypothetical protein